MANRVRKLFNLHATLVLHEICTYMVILVPLIYPMMGVVRPTLADWGRFLVYGILGFFGFLTFLKACQTDNSGKILGIQNTLLYGIILCDAIYGGVFMNLWSLLGLVAILVGNVFIVKNTKRRISTNSFNAFELGQRWPEQEQSVRLTLKDGMAGAFGEDEVEMDEIKR